MALSSRRLRLHAGCVELLPVQAPQHCSSAAPAQPVPPRTQLGEPRPVLPLLALLQWHANEPSLLPLSHIGGCARHTNAIVSQRRYGASHVGAMPQGVIVVLVNGVCGRRRLVVGVGLVGGDQVVPCIK